MSKRMFTISTLLALLVVCAVAQTRVQPTTAASSSVGRFQLVQARYPYMSESNTTASPFAFRLTFALDSGKYIYTASHVLSWNSLNHSRPSR